MTVKNRAVLEALVQAGNASLAKLTLAKYGTEESHIKGAEMMTGVKFSYPTFYKGNDCHIHWLSTPVQVTRAQGIHW